MEFMVVIDAQYVMHGMHQLAAAGMHREPAVFQGKNGDLWTAVEDYHRKAGYVADKVKARPT